MQNKTKIDDILDPATNLLPDDEIIDDDIKIDNIFTDDDGLFEERNLKPEHRKFIEDLLRKTNFAEIGNLIPETKPIVKTEIKPLDLKYEDVVFEGTDSSDDDIVDGALSDAETSVFDNMSNNKTTLPEKLSDAETEFYNLSDAETIGYTSDIDFMKNNSQHPKKRMKKKLRDKIKKETIESNKNKLKNKKI